MVGRRMGFFSIFGGAKGTAACAVSLHPGHKTNRAVLGRSRMSVTSWLRPAGTRCVIALSMLAAVGAARGQELSLGNVNPPKQGTSQAAQQFIDKLAEVSSGKIKVVHHHS